MGWLSVGSGRSNLIRQVIVYPATGGLRNGPGENVSLISLRPHNGLSMAWKGAPGLDFDTSPQGCCTYFLDVHGLDMGLVQMQRISPLSPGHPLRDLLSRTVYAIVVRATQYHPIAPDISATLAGGDEMMDGQVLFGTAPVTGCLAEDGVLPAGLSVFWIDTGLVQARRTSGPANTWTWLIQWDQFKGVDISIPISDRPFMVNHGHRPSF